MKKLGLLVSAVLMLLIVTPVFAQEHADVGVYADYVNLNQLNQGFWGIGGRVGFGLAPHVSMEADMAYDFAQSFTGTDNFGFTTNTSMHLLHGTFGPKIYADFGGLRVFALAKGGFIHFSGGSGASLNSFTGVLANFNSPATDAVFYPGAGIEIHHGWIGLRAEAGDLMYFANGAHSNLSIRVGPEFTF